MPKISTNRAIGIAVAVIVVAALAWLAWPSPVPVDLAKATRSSMEVTVDEEARTRVRQVYTVSAPLTGTVLRSGREVGDFVKANETVVVAMKPTAPSFHDPRLHQELLSALSAAEAAVALAIAERQRVEAALNYARQQLGRMKSLAGDGTVSRSTLDKATADAEMTEAAVARAVAEVQVRRNERDSAAARLKNPVDAGLASADGAGCCVQIRAPITGLVLSLLQKSETVVPAGTPLIEIGDPQDLEIVAELLSADAVQVRVGADVRIDGWGGEAVRGRVRRVEPSGFLKISALGIEEQRVRAIVDVLDPPERRASLGHDYRVIVHIVTWKADKVLTVPVGALFRANNEWSVFKVTNGRAKTAAITVGHRNSRTAEVLSGLTDGDEVVLHPSDRVSDGARVAQRE